DPSRVQLGAEWPAGAARFKKGGILLPGSFFASPLHGLQRSTSPLRRLRAGIRLRRRRAAAPGFERIPSRAPALPRLPPVPETGGVGPRTPPEPPRRRAHRDADPLPRRLRRLRAGHAAPLQAPGRPAALLRRMLRTAPGLGHLGGRAS